MAGPKSILNMELFKSNLTEEAALFRANETILLKERTLVLGLVGAVSACLTCAWRPGEQHGGQPGVAAVGHLPGLAS